MSTKGMTKATNPNLARPKNGRKRGSRNKTSIGRDMAEAYAAFGHGDLDKDMMKDLSRRINKGELTPGERNVIYQHLYRKAPEEQDININAAMPQIRIVKPSDVAMENAKLKAAEFDPEVEFADDIYDAEELNLTSTDDPDADLITGKPQIAGPGSGYVEH